MMTLVLVIWGVWSAGKLPIDALPDITNNQVQIITVCPTLAGQEVEQLVTFLSSKVSPICLTLKSCGVFHVLDYR